MNLRTIEPDQLIKRLPKRTSDSHKGQFGTVTVIGGARGMVGAALLAGRAALKLGAGCVHVTLLAEDAPAVDLVQPELMTHRNLPDFHPLLNLPPEKSDEANVKSIFNADVLAVGCGMGTDSTAQKMLGDALQSPATLVLDADALNMIASYRPLREQLTTRQGETVLTPHPGEAARLLACSTMEIQNNRIAAIQKLAAIFHCTIVLKGNHSLCATADGLYINNTGNPGMSAPGMGDVLTGMIAALIAQGMNAKDALLLGVYLHGAAGDELAKQGAALGMTASEVTDMARRLLNQWTTSPD